MPKISMNELDISLLNNSLYRQAIINSNFQVWQRGTSGFSPSGSVPVYVADRWTAFRANYALGITVSRQLSGLSNSQYCARLQRNSGNTDVSYMTLCQNLETINSIPFAGQIVTLSAKVRKGSNFGGGCDITLVEGTGTDQRADLGFTGNKPTKSMFTPTTTWQTYYVTTAIGTNTTQLAVSINASPVGTAGTNDYIEITDVQLHLGNKPLMYCPKSFSDELIDCMRYYEVLRATLFCDITVAHAILYMMEPKVSKRIAPTVTIGGTDKHSFLTEFGVSSSNKDYIVLSTTASSAGAGLYNYASVTLDAEM